MTNRIFPCHLHKSNFFKNAIVIFIAIFLSTVSYGQEEPSKATIKKGQFGLAPYFTYNTALGAGFGLVPMYSFRPSKKDSISVESVIGGGGFYTTNKSYVYGVFGALFFDENKWRVFYALASGVFNFQTYLEIPIIDEGIFINYATNSTSLIGKVRRNLFGNTYAGIGLGRIASTTSFEEAIDADLNINLLQLELFQDTRDYLMYPKKGSVIMLAFNSTPEWLGNEENSNILIANINKYLPMQQSRDVLAFRFHAKAGLKNIHFQQQAVLGGTDLRGYSQGKYRGDGVIDIQGEYRWNFPNKYRLGMVGFLGVGTVYGSATESFNWKAYPSIGAGIRYTVLDQTHFNVGLDFGVGKDDWGIYFRISEAF